MSWKTKSYYLAYARQLLKLSLIDVAKHLKSISEITGEEEAENVLSAMFRLIQLNKVKEA